MTHAVPAARAGDPVGSTGPTDWSVAIFTSREDAGTLRRTVQAVLAACRDRATIIDVLVDGNPTTAAALAAWEPERVAGSTLRLWLVPWRDKACTWNRFLHELAPVATTAFFIDGYVRPAADSLAALAAALAARDDAWAATAVPTVGPSAAAQRARLVADGGLHGNLYALRGAVVALLRERGFRLPLGLYRNDSLIGAVMAFAADPARQAWDPHRRIALVTGATWDNDVASPFDPSRLRAFGRRRMRQAQGALENAAVRQHLAERRQSPETLPRTVQELVAAGPVRPIAWQGPIDRFLTRRAARAIAAPADWTRCDAEARLVRRWPAA